MKKMRSARFDRHLTAFWAIVALFLMVAPVFAQQPDTIKVGTELDNLNVIVMNRDGRPVGGLKKEDFEVYEDGKRQELTHFSAEQKSLRLVLLFDTSISMIAVLPGVKREAIALLSNLHPNDEVSVVSFASQVRLLSDWLPPDQANQCRGS
jgi:Ca-activated chloride channel homolog